MADLSKTVALVTGGAQGIGRSFVENLLKGGAKVAIGDLKNSAGAATQKELEAKYPGKVIFVPCNVVDTIEFEAAIKATIKQFGTINTLINNAGVVNETDDGWPTMVRINVDAIVFGTKLGFKYMSKANGGTGGLIINIASITSFCSWDTIPVYSATKAFVNQFSRCMGRPVHHDTTGVKVVAINPGLSDTSILLDVNKYPIRDVEAVSNCLKTYFDRFPVQKVENMGRELITVLTKAENGSLWVIENDQPAKKVDIQTVYE